MSEHPLDLIRHAIRYDPDPRRPGIQVAVCRDDCPRCAVEQLEQAARNLDGYANDESGPYVLVRLDELRALTAALALFDRKEQTPETATFTCPCGYEGDTPCNGCPEGCKRRPAGVTGWDHIDRKARP